MHRRADAGQTGQVVNDRLPELSWPLGILPEIVEDAEMGPLELGHGADEEDLMVDAIVVAQGASRERLTQGPDLRVERGATGRLKGGGEQLLTIWGGDQTL